jgi:hypothetical protein
VNNNPYSSKIVLIQDIVIRTSSSTCGSMQRSHDRAGYRKFVYLTIQGAQQSGLLRHGTCCTGNYIVGRRTVVGATDCYWLPVYIHNVDGVKYKSKTGNRRANGCSFGDKAAKRLHRHHLPVVGVTVKQVVDHIQQLCLSGSI